jgi:hypothetical protein
MPPIKLPRYRALSPPKIMSDVDPAIITMRPSFGMRTKFLHRSGVVRPGKFSETAMRFCDGLIRKIAKPTSHSLPTIHHQSRLLSLDCAFQTREVPQRLFLDIVR